MEKKEHEMNLNVFGSPTQQEENVSKEKLPLCHGKRSTKRKIISTSDGMKLTINNINIKIVKQKSIRRIQRRKRRKKMKKKWIMRQK